MDQFSFYLLAFLTCGFALLTVISRDVFHSAVWLATTLLSIAGIYFYMSAEFLAVIQIMVYVGGIITLFVFAIKLTAHIGDRSIKQANEQVVISAIASLAFLFLLFRVIKLNPWAKTLPESMMTDVSLPQLGQSLLTTYVLPFEFISLLLLGVMVGAIVIGKVKK